MHTHISNLSMSTLCICHPYFAFSMHIAPLAEEAYAEQEPLVQEPDEEIEVQPPQEEQAYPEQQQEYYDAPEATGALTSDLANQGRPPMHLNLCK